MAPTIYLDYNATTPLDAGVKEAMLPFLGEIYGNPSSIHQVGRRARALLDEARDRVATVWGCKPSEVVFTSGGTEANNLAIFGTARLLKEKGRHLITSQIEHHAVLNCFEYLQAKEGFDVTYLPVDSFGRIAPDALKAAFRDDTMLVSLMAANNEVGTRQPISELGALCQERGVVFHTDAVQSFGKEPFTDIHQFGANLVTCCGHKFHGPKGVGALYIESPLHPDPIQFGGGHENERRAGTENMVGIMGLATAIESFVQTPVFDDSRLRALTNELINAVRVIPGVTQRGHPEDRLSNTAAFSVAGTDGVTLMANLDLDGISASSGSACSAGSLNPSHVLKAMGVPPAEANSLVRFSLGRDSTETEIRRVTELLPVIIRRSQQLE